MDKPPALRAQSSVLAVKDAPGAFVGRRLLRLHPNPGLAPCTGHKHLKSVQLANKQTNRAWWCQHMGILAIPGLGRTLDLLQVIWELINQPECGQNSETNGGETAT